MKHVLSFALLVGFFAHPAHASVSSDKVARLLTQRCDLDHSLRVAESSLFIDTNIEEGKKILNCIVATDPGVTAKSADFNAYHFAVQIAKALATGKADKVTAVVDQSLNFSFE